VRQTVLYAVTGLLGLAVVVAPLWLWLGAAARPGILFAAVVAWTVQVGAFAVLIRYRGGTRGFLAAWVGGTLVRLALILLAAWAVIRTPALEPAPTLLGLAGFFFALLLLEPLFFGRELKRTETA
jgi:Na+-transporting methylmalonyl-CoA/oxaloacetate decarboxylase beta subunit